MIFYTAITGCIISLFYGLTLRSRISSEAIYFSFLFLLIAAPIFIIHCLVCLVIVTVHHHHWYNIVAIANLYFYPPDKLLPFSPTLFLNPLGNN